MQLIVVVIARGNLVYRAQLRSQDLENGGVQRRKWRAKHAPKMLFSHAFILRVELEGVRVLHVHVHKRREKIFSHALILRMIARF